MGGLQAKQTAQSVPNRKRVASSKVAQNQPRGYEVTFFFRWTRPQIAERTVNCKSYCCESEGVYIATAQCSGRDGRRVFSVAASPGVTKDTDVVSSHWSGYGHVHRS